MMVANDVFLVPTLVCNLDAKFLRESGLADMDLGEANSALKSRLLIATSEGVTREYEEIHRLITIYELPNLI